MRKNSNSKIPPLWRTSNVNKTSDILSNSKRKRLFLSLGGKSQQGYKLKIHNIQVYDSYQIKKEEHSGDISKFPPVQ